MDCVMIDKNSFELLREQMDELNKRNNVLEKENDCLKNKNNLLYRLTNCLENIKFNLEKINELIRLKYTIDDCFQPFEKDYMVCDEEFCNIKCLLNSSDDDFDDNNDNIDETEDNIIISNNDSDIMNQNQDSNDGEMQDFDEELNVKSIVWGEERIGDDFNDNNMNESENYGLIDDSKISAIVLSDDLINRPKNRRNRKSALPEGVIFSIQPGDKRYTCSWPECQYATNSSGNFQKHYRIHTGEKPFKCDFEGCEYSCSDPGSIREHKRIHSAEKEFKCDWPGCHWRFATFKLLKNHTRACHTGEKPHKCDWPGCEKSFLAPYALRTHKLKHTGDRPFKCDMIGCKAAFTRSTDLLRHKRETHCSERHFPCEYENCDSSFYRKDDLRHHIKRKHECPSFVRKRKVRKADSKLRPIKILPKSEVLDEKVVIDLNVAKTNQLKKSFPN